MNSGPRTSDWSNPYAVKQSKASQERPNSHPLRAACSELLDQKPEWDPKGRTNAQIIAAVLVSMAIGGNIGAMRELNRILEIDLKSGEGCTELEERPTPQNERELKDRINEIYGFNLAV